MWERPGRDASENKAFETWREAPIFRNTVLKYIHWESKIPTLNSEEIIWKVYGGARADIVCMLDWNSISIPSVIPRLTTACPRYSGM
eukprot:gene21853-biopygen7624